MKNKRQLIVMNNPNAPLDEEISFILECGFDGLELTLEPPYSYFSAVEIHKELILKNIVIGHTRDDLKFASNIETERQDSIVIMKESLDLFKTLGVKRVNIHPHRGSSGLSRDEVFELNIKSLNDIVPHASNLGIELMIENQPPFTLVTDMERIFKEVNGPLYLLLDLAHATCYGSESETIAFLIKFKDRIKHLHISDNMGSSDDHLFPGYGVLDFRKYFEVINDNISSDVVVSLESFRVLKEGKYSLVEDSKRFEYVRNAQIFLREMIDI